MAMGDLAVSPLHAVLIFCVFAAIAIALCLLWHRADAWRRSMDAPFTVTFSRERPMINDPNPCDAWVHLREDGSEVLFFHPARSAWRSQSLPRDVGHAFVDGQLIAFRAFKTSVGPELVAKLTKIADTTTIDDALMDELSAMDPYEVFTVVEMLGLVREVSAALTARAAGSVAESDLDALFRGRRFDLD